MTQFMGLQRHRIGHDTEQANEGKSKWVHDEKVKMLMMFVGRGYSHAAKAAESVSFCPLM